MLSAPILRSTRSGRLAAVAAIAALGLTGCAGQGEQAQSSQEAVDLDRVAQVEQGTSDQGGWGHPYTGGGVYDPNDAVGGHYDHIHVSFVR